MDTYYTVHCNAELLHWYTETQQPEPFFVVPNVTVHRYTHQRTSHRIALQWAVAVSDIGSRKELMHSYYLRLYLVAVVSPFVTDEAANCMVYK